MQNFHANLFSIIDDDIARGGIIGGIQLLDFALNGKMV